MRVFLALCLPEKMEQACVEMQQMWKEKGVTGRFTRTESLHITLFFFGGLNEQQVQTVEQVISSDVPAACPLKLSQAGHFKSLYYAGITAPAPFCSWVEKTGERLRDAGLSLEKRPFFPHITLVRKAQNVPEILPFIQQSGTASDMILFESDLSGPAPVYTPLKIWKLN